MSGKVVNLASNDVHKLKFDQVWGVLCLYHITLLIFFVDLAVLPLFWVGPLHLALVTYFIYTVIGPTSFLAIATFLVILQIPLQVFLPRLLSGNAY